MFLAITVHVSVVTSCVRMKYVMDVVTHNGLHGVVVVKVVMQAIELDPESELLERVTRAAIWPQKNLKIATLYLVRKHHCGVLGVHGKNALPLVEWDTVSERELATMLTPIESVQE